MIQLTRQEHSLAPPSVARLEQRTWTVQSHRNLFVVGQRDALVQEHVGGSQSRTHWKQMMTVWNDLSRPVSRKNKIENHTGTNKRACSIPLDLYRRVIPCPRAVF